MPCSASRRVDLSIDPQGGIQLGACDAENLRRAAAAMQIGDTVLYQGQRYLLHGFTRAGSTEQHAVIAEAETGEFVTVPLEQVERVAPDE